MTNIAEVKARRQNFAFDHFSSNIIAEQYYCSQLENVATANALQLQAARRRAVSIHFNFAAPAHVKFEVAQPFRCRLIAFLLLIRYIMLRS